MDILITLLPLPVGLVLGYVTAWAFDRPQRRFWRNMALKAFNRAPMSTQPPTNAVPNWGPNLVECTYCDGVTMSQAAMNEHLRARHGDS